MTRGDRLVNLWLVLATLAFAVAAAFAFGTLDDTPSEVFPRPERVLDQDKTRGDGL